MDSQQPPRAPGKGQGGRPTFPLQRGLGEPPRRAGPGTLPGSCPPVLAASPAARAVPVSVAAFAVAPLAVATGQRSWRRAARTSGARALLRRGPRQAQALLPVLLLGPSGFRPGSAAPGRLPPALSSPCCSWEGYSFPHSLRTAPGGLASLQEQFWVLITKAFLGFSVLPPQRPRRDG